MLKFPMMAILLLVTGILISGDQFQLKDFDAAKITVNGKVTVRKNGEKLIVRIPAEQPIHWPGINIKPQNGARYFDLSSGSVLAVDLRNLTDRQIAVKCQIENPGANGQEHCMRGGMALEAGEKATLRVRYYRNGLAPDSVRFEGGKNAPEGLAGRCNLDVKKIANIMLFVRPYGKEIRFEVSNLRLEEPFQGVSEAVRSAETFFPAIDRYGQYKHKEWPGKTHSDADLIAAREAETADLAKNPPPRGWNRFGGWADGPALEATGRFRTAKYKGKWYLVDPEGKLFFSHGICQFEQDQVSGVTLREHYFEGLPPVGSREAKGYYRKQGYAPGSDNFYRRKKVVPDAYDFFGANLRRKYGTDWQNAYRRRLYERAASWGINTLANWSLTRYMQDGKMPYVIQTECRKGPVIAGHAGGAMRRFPDVFDPGFEESILTALKRDWAFAAEDPMCIGAFVDNEHNWGKDTSLAEAVIASPAEQAAKQGFLRWLKQKYRSLRQWNEAWKSSYDSFDAFLQSTRIPNSPAAKKDLIAFNDLLVERYFEGARRAVKKFSPEMLYLGARFAGIPSRRIQSAAARHCDVVSFNLYEYTVEDLRLPENADVPVLISEFHFGTIANGNPHPGVQGSVDDAARGHDYAAYVTGALRNPLIVGTHYYRLIDQSMAGRSLDDENFSFGFLDICDRPYPEMVAAARQVAGKLYQIRNENQQ